MEVSRDLFELISNNSVSGVIGTFKCALCSYSSEKDLSKHYLTHINEIIECPGCSLLYQDIQEFQQHNYSCTAENDNNPNRICQPTFYENRRILGFEDSDLLPFDSIEDFHESTVDIGLEVDQVDEDQTSFNCDYCNKSFKKLKSLEKHIKTHNEHKYRCKYCNIEFLLNTSLKIHLKKHEGQNNVLQCLTCNIPYANESDLKVHIRKNHPEEKLQSIKCLECGKIFKKNCELRKHQKIHNQNFRPHSCKICEKTFVHLTSLRNHEITHSVEKKHQCNFCGQFFSFRGNLKVHIRSRHFPDQKDFACTYCEKRFSRSSNLKEHINTHTKDKLNKCEFNDCGKTFTSSSTLSKHKKIHLGLRNFVCVVCQKTFLQSSHLKKHSKIHTNEKSYFCSICNKYFRRSDTLLIHKRIHEKQTVTSEAPNNMSQEIIISSQIIIPPINISDNSEFFPNPQSYQISYQIPENWNQNQL